MIEVLKEIFTLLNISELLGYILIIFFLFLIFLGGLYIRNYFDTSLHKKKLLNEKDFVDLRKNSDEIKKLLYEVENVIIRPIDNDRVVFNPDKIDLIGLITKANRTLYENTYNFSEKIKIPLSNLEKVLNSLNLKNPNNISAEERHIFFKENSIAKGILDSSSRDLKYYINQIESEFKKIKL